MDVIKVLVKVVEVVVVLLIVVVPLVVVVVVILVIVVVKVKKVVVTSVLGMQRSYNCQNDLVFSQTVGDVDVSDNIQTGCSNSRISRSISGSSSSNGSRRHATIITSVKTIPYSLNCW